MKTLDKQAIQFELEKHSLQDWIIADNHIEKTFLLKDFKTVLTIFKEVGEKAEAMNHHPNWQNVYNKLHIELSTHDANGVTTKDIQLAVVIESEILKYN